MQPADRLQKIEEIFHAALARAPQERSNYVAAACVSEPDLRAEVSALLAAHEEAQTPSHLVNSQAQTKVMAERQRRFRPGQKLNRYRLIGPLGRGGMSEVYLAEDAALGRRVALKILPEEMMCDKDLVRRFEREARAASALNHPNIITIYEVVHSEEAHFIVTEFVAGQTLRQRIGRGGFNVADALEIVVQSLAALEAAHAAGVAHRDMKPENIMLRDDGLVKVLDFGLAKRVSASDASLITQPGAGETTNTSSGLVLGTLAYMSPEQARGQEVDARTDLFSMGIVLYELIAGCRPFRGETPGDVMAALLTQEPPPLTQYVPGAPTELQTILNRALSKSRGARYQTSREMLADLRHLKQRLESATTVRQVSRVSSPQEKRNVVTAGHEVMHTSSTAEVIVSEIKRHKVGASFVLAFLALLFVGAGLGLYGWLTRGTGGGGSLVERMKLTPLTDDGQIESAAISPDGRYLVNAVEENGLASLQLKPLPTGNPLTIVPPAQVRYHGMNFTPDGASIYYMAEDAQGGHVLSRVGIFGGPPRGILGPRGGPLTPVSFSPDGRRMALVRFLPSTSESALLTLNADGTGERQVIARKYPDEILWPTWSPDGRTIAYALTTTQKDGQLRQVAAVPAAGGAERILGGSRWATMHQLAWLTDGSGVLVTAQELTGRSKQVWLLSWPDGAVRRVTNDLNDYSYVSVTGDGNALATVQTAQVSSLWVVPVGAPQQAQQITSGVGRADGLRGVAWSPDGSIVYDTREGTGLEIWKFRPEGGERAQVTFNSRTSARPVVTADGRYVVFNSNRSGLSSIWRADADGGNLRQLTRETEDAAPSVSPDGRWVVYQAAAEGTVRLWKVPLDGGTPVRLTDRLTMRPAISPDGHTLACYAYNEQANVWEIGLLPFWDGVSAPMRTLPLPAGAENDLAVRWAADGRALYVVLKTNGVSDIWRQPLDGSLPQLVTNFKSQLIFSFDVSRDGKQIVCARGSFNKDAVLLSGFRPTP